MCVEGGSELAVRWGGGVGGIVSGVHVGGSE